MEVLRKAGKGEDSFLHEALYNHLLRRRETQLPRTNMFVLTAVCRVFVLYIPHTVLCDPSSCSAACDGCLAPSIR